MEKDLESRIKKAFWAMFHKSGEAYFDYQSSEEDCEASTVSYWNEFLEKLNKEGKVNRESQIKKAFWAAFHLTGEVWFNDQGTEEECEESTVDNWKEFLEELNKSL